MGVVHGEGVGRQKRRVFHPDTQCRLDPAGQGKDPAVVSPRQVRLRCWWQVAGGGETLHGISPWEPCGNL